MTRTLETIYSEWKDLDRHADTLPDAESEKWTATLRKMDALEIEMRQHPATTLREAAMKLEPLMVNSERDPNFTGIVEDLRAHLAPAERVEKVCPSFVFCARGSAIPQAAE